MHLYSFGHLELARNTLGIRVNTYHPVYRMVVIAYQYAIVILRWPNDTEHIAVIPVAVLDQDVTILIKSEYMYIPPYVNNVIP